MSKSRTAALILLFVFSSATAAICADKESPKPTVKDAAKPKKELTKGDFIEHIKGRLDRTKEIMNFIPGLKRETDTAGKASYAYQGKKLEDIDKEELKKLYFRVNEEGVRLQTERLTKQLENIRRANELTRQIQQVNKIPTAPQQPPAVYIPPQPPAPPAAVQQPPKPPTPTPTSPRR